MSFKLSRRSLDRLEGIDDSLQAVVKMAITLTKTDFGVVQGMRTITIIIHVIRIILALVFKFFSWHITPLCLTSSPAAYPR